MTRICLPLVMFAACFTFSAAIANADDPTRQIEMGNVNWNRDFETARKIARQTGKPLLVLFQEIPGCQTCKNFGRQSLSHPLAVEAMEDLFVPVLVYNNRKGEDELLLKRFSEPAWNNPVVRYLDGDGQDLIARKEGVWTVAGTAQRMIAALKANDRKVPDYLLMLAAETDSKTETATFAMHCYWEGEGLLGSVKGVTSTRSAWRDGLEVVDVEFDPTIVDYTELVDAAHTLDCASKVFRLHRTTTGSRPQKSRRTCGFGRPKSSDACRQRIRPKILLKANPADSFASDGISGHQN